MTNVLELQQNRHSIQNILKYTELISTEFIFFRSELIKMQTPLNFSYFFYYSFMV